MALNRFVRFSTTTAVPGKITIDLDLRSYIQISGKVEWKSDRFFVTFPGLCEPAARTEQPWERWMEVWIGDDCVDVITRMADDYTNAVAEGYAKRIARKWEGKLEQ